MEQNLRKPFLISEALLASHGQRFVNLLIDSLVQLLLLFIVLVFMVAGMELKESKAYLDHFAVDVWQQYTFTASVTLFYYNVFEIFTARTVGKWITQTVVVDENGEKPNHEMILVRSLCRLIPLNWLPFLLSLFMGSSAKGWHDSISKTYVVDKRALEQEKREFYQSKSNPNEE